MAKRKKQPRQRSLPGTQSPKNISIEKAAHEYVEARDERMALSEVEVTRKTKLLDVMKRANLTKYRRNGMTIDIVVEKEKVKVRTAKAATEDNDEGGETEQVSV